MVTASPSMRRAGNQFTTIPDRSVVAGDDRRLLVDLSVETRPPVVAELRSGGPAVMPEEPVSGTKQMRMSSDPGAYPSSCPDSCLVRRR